ncbi:MAG TPA: PepSY-associated TM helix domain-containing protein [Burkholderiales bacterium]|jgi:uncharacterized iron-regulated membrane protein
MKGFWLQLHLWLGLTLGALGIFIGATGSILVYDHAIDAWLNPQRYAVSGAQVALPYAEYTALASQAVSSAARVVNLRLPEEDGMPITAIARPREGSQFLRVYLDPATGKVLDAVPGGGFVGWIHRFHENLTLREYWGREVVGLVGVAMLISALTGMYLWWPGRNRFRQALGARPGLALSRNLHYLAGFYGSIVLALLSFTGIWLAYVQYVQPARIVQVQGSGGPTTVTLDAAVSTARALGAGASLVSVGLPTGPRGAYRVNLRGERGPLSVFVDPATGVVLRHTEPGGIDRFLSVQRMLHTGTGFGFVGRLLLCLAGLLPALLVTTGAIMWLRQRRSDVTLRRRVALTAGGG